jgi:phospholipase D1/2
MSHRLENRAPWFAAGRNCWAVERANRFLVIQDGEDYYRLLRDAILRAEHSVLILGWDITGGTILVPKDPAGPVPARFDEFVRYAAKRRPNVQFHILTWDYGLLFTMERDPFTRWRLGWRTPRNVHFAFDAHHPVGACHHQKVVVIDDSLAFSGSMDITGHRWDTREHIVRDPARLDPRGRPYDPYHEVQAMLEGPAAAKLGELARIRWRAVGAKRVPPPAPNRADLWPDDISPDFTDVNVAIARTWPAGIDGPGARECEALYLEAIARARRTIYLENQYFTHPRLSAALGARLAEPNGPEVLIVVPRGGDGWLDRNTITVLRDGLFRELVARDANGRLRITFPVASRSEDVSTFIHSKVLVVDDQLVIVGSANTNRRSMGMDTECDVAVAAQNATEAATIEAIRDRLIAEHLGVSRAEVAAHLNGGHSLADLIDRFQTRDRTLALVELRAADPAEVDETVQYVVDPDKPISVGSDIEAAVPAVNSDATRVPLRVWISPTVALLAAVTVAWASSDAVDRQGLVFVQRALEATRTSALSNGPIVVVFLVAGLVLVPLELVVVATGALLGLGRGALVSVVGSMVIAVLAYVAGRWLGPQAVANWVTSRSRNAVRDVGAQGVTGIAMVRLAGVASAGAIHLLAGAHGVPFGSYLAGTAIGLLPSVAALTVLGSLLGDTVVRPSLGRAAATGGVALVVLAAALGLRAFLLIRQFGPAMARHRARTEIG